MNPPQKTDLAELFDRDPMQLSKPDVEQIIHELRRLRHTFNQIKAPATKKAAAKTASPLGLNLDLEL